MKSVLFIKNAAMTTDLLTYLKKLSLFLQKPNINIAEGMDYVQTMTDNLCKLKQRLV